MTATTEQQLDEALAKHERSPNDLSVLRRIAELLVDSMRDDELLPWANKGLALDPRNPYFVYMRARAQRMLGHHHEAVATWLTYQALPWKPQFYQLKLGRDMYLSGNVERAIPLLRSAMELAQKEADTGVAQRAENWLAEALLSIGHTQGFMHWLIRNLDDSGNYRPDGIPTWAGEQDLRGRRVLITHQMGFGDQFLLFACVKHWLAAGATLMVTCDPQIHRLIEASLPQCTVIAAQRPLPFGAPLPDAIMPAVEAFAPDMHASLLHLPMLAATHSPLPDPYFPAWISAPAAHRESAQAWASALRAKHPGKVLVGLFWDCGQRHQPRWGSVNRCWAALRSVPLDMLNRLVLDPALIDKVHFVGLHHPDLKDQTGEPAGNFSDYEPGIRNFADTAACIEQLDAVVSVDSGIANLSAMVGKPTAVMLNAAGEWRWGHNDGTSPWMRHVTLLRQTLMGDWSTVVGDAVRWLSQFTARIGRQANDAIPR